MNIRLLVNIDVDDLPRATAFYTAAFGLTVGRRFGPHAVELNGGDSAVYLLAHQAGSPGAGGEQRRYTRHWTPVHLDIVVDDVEAALARATAAGAVAEGAIKTHSWGRIVTVADPFGHGICLLQFLNRGYDEIAD
jgi:lactoylglutathione lyase